MTTIHDLIAAADRGIQAVPVGNGLVEMRPITMIEILRVMRRYPGLKQVFFGDTGALIDILLDVGPEAVGALLACASNAPGDAKAEAGILTLPDEQLIALLSAAIRITMPNGIESFFGKLAAMASAAGLLSDSQGELSDAA